MKGGSHFCQSPKGGGGVGAREGGPTLFLEKKIPNFLSPHPTRKNVPSLKRLISTTIATLGLHNKPLSIMELRFLVKYSRVFGIFRLKLAAEVESNMMRAISSGIPPGFTGLLITSSFGDTCICTSLWVFQN